jgi:SSS family solute:Na+ symporter
VTTLPGHGAQLGIFIVLFGLVTVLGFAAARWQRPDSMHALDEWGLGGRAFGNMVTFFLLGGDIYTAYTFIAVPALVYGEGAPGFFVVPFAVIQYPLVFVALPRLWSVAHVHGFVTPAEFVRARFGSPALSTLVAVAAIVGTMPYIALQLLGLELVLQAMGLSGAVPLTVAFGLLASFTFNSGLRAPALIAIVKDLLIVMTVLTMLLWVAITPDGWAGAFHAAAAKFAGTPAAGGGLLLAPAGQLSYATLALGSALALFLYPHTVTGVLAARNRATIKRSLAAMPVYTLLLGVFALLGFAAISAGVHPADGNANTVTPQLFQSALNQSGLGDWGAGVAFAALAIGALVPASIMSIGAANLFTRSIYRQFIRPGATAGQETRVSRTASLLVKLGAIAVVLLLTPQFAIDLQLMGGVIILQIFPAAAIGLYTNWFHRRALIAGLITGLASGIAMLYQIPKIGLDGETVISKHFGGDSWPLAHLGWHTTLTVYAGLLALGVNLAVTTLGTLACRWRRVPDGADLTQPSDYTADDDDATVQRMPELIDGLQQYQGRHTR